MTTLTRRDLLATSAAIGATLCLNGRLSAADPVGKKKTFSILHTNDMHASFIGMGPSLDYTPFTVNDDTTRGGYARLAGLLTQRTQALRERGPVLTGCRRL
jgi:5'-nucleotidase / UDP-sugar diphosphatase